jgi:alpha-acetolactate decarboxylase
VLGGVSGALCGALNVGGEVEDEMVGEATVEVNENERLNLKFPFRFRT